MDPELLTGSGSLMIIQDPDPNLGGENKKSLELVGLRLSFTPLGSFKIIIGSLSKRVKIHGK
jgi:hypothetical protein